MNDEAIVHYNYDTSGQLMDIYINDGTFDGTQWTTTQYATGGNNDGILMKEYLKKPYWQTYANAGKLHRYFPLTVTMPSGPRCISVSVRNCLTISRPTSCRRK